MNKTLFKLRLFGIAAFMLFMIAEMIKLPFGFRSNYYVYAQQTLILVALVIFALLIVIQGYNFLKSLGSHD